VCQKISWENFPSSLQRKRLWEIKVLQLIEQDIFSADMKKEKLYLAGQLFVITDPKTVLHLKGSSLLQYVKFRNMSAFLNINRYVWKTSKFNLSAIEYPLKTYPRSLLK
jgi:hypothetical protein